MHALFFEPPLTTNFLGHQIKEIYFDKIYEPFLQGRKDLTILDVGAMGVTPYYFSQYAKKVYALEPSSETFEILKRMVMFNKLENVELINKAIWINNDRLSFGGPDENKTMRSLHMATWQEGKAVEEVQCITFEELFEEHNIEHVDLCKVDIEGSEFQVLAHPTFKAVAPKVDIVIVEIHAWANRVENQIYESLKAAGFNSVEKLGAEANLIVAKK